MDDEKGLPKPGRVEVGQRWRWGDAKYTLVGPRMGGIPGFRGLLEGSKDGFGAFNPSDFTSDRMAFLGWADGYGPKAKVMAEDACAFPVSCLGCGGAKGGCPFVCEACFPGWSQYGQRLVDAWEAGARDFPRPRTRETAAEAHAPTEPAKSPPSASQGPQEAFLNRSLPPWALVGKSHQSGTWTIQGDSRIVKLPPEFRYGWPDFYAQERERLLPLDPGGADAMAYTVVDDGKALYSGVHPELPPAAPAPPTRYEVSTNGRDVLQYERLIDPDPVESYPYWRRAGAGAWDGTCPAMVTARKDLALHAHRLNDRIMGRQMIEDGRATAKPAPEPWRPSVLDEDLLCEDAGR
jgi:hypothetical protein